LFFLSLLPATKCSSAMGGFWDRVLCFVISSQNVALFVLCF